MDASSIKHFVFYRSYDEALSCLDDVDRLRVFDAMRDFAFRGCLPSFDPKKAEDFNCYLCWTLIRPSIEKSMENQKNGQRGGRPPKEPKQ